MLGTGPAAEKLLVLTAKPDKTGFFHIDGVAPGAYAVRAQYGRVLYSPEIEVEVRPGREAELIDPVVLDYPRQVRVTITPASTPANKPWHVRLAKLIGEQHLDAVTESNATTDGAWQSPRVPAPLSPVRRTVVSGRFYLSGSECRSAAKYRTRPH